MFNIIKWLKKKNEIITQVELGHTFYRHPMWESRMFILKKALPGIKEGAIFRQTYQSDHVYFHAIAISAEVPEKDQVGIIEFEARYVENNPEWFIDVVEQGIIDDIRNSPEKFFYD